VIAATPQDLPPDFLIAGAIIMAMMAFGCLWGLRRRGLGYQLQLVFAGVICFLALVGAFFLVAILQQLLAGSG
jgi:hypothetical protein